MLVCAVSVSAQSAANWTEYTDEDLGLRVAFPGAISRSSEMVGTGAKKDLAVTFTSKFGGAIFILSVTEIPEGNNEPLKELFDGAREGMLSVGTDAKVTSEKDVKVVGRAARDVSLTTKEFGLRTRLFYVDGRLYQMLVMIPPAMAKDAKVTADMVKFIESITFISTAAK